MDVEKFEVQGGSFGPLAEGMSLELRPLTLLIGEQGVGKSLISQMLYFLRDMPYLLYAHQEEVEAGTPEALVKGVADRIRSGRSGRRLESFLPPQGKAVRLQWQSQEAARVISIRRQREIVPLQAGWRGPSVEAWMRQWKGSIPKQKAIFIPAERNLYSRFGFSQIAKLSNIPLQEFAQLLDEAGGSYDRWERGVESRPAEAEWIDHRGWDALRGRVRYAKRGPYAGQWQWLPEETGRPIEIDMASSGQIEAWPLVVVAEYLFGLSSKERPRYIHIEEPEAHLHPRAQVEMVHLLAYLVNHGFQVLITTHSLTVLFAMNNLLMAGQLRGEAASARGLPPREAWLKPGSASAYLLTTEGQARPLLDEGRGLILEDRLSEVDERLGDQYDEMVELLFPEEEIA